MTTTPDGIVLRRHLHLEQRVWPVHFRRAIITLLAAICLAALLDQFGQATDTKSARSAQGTLSVTSPTRLRGGLMFTARFTIVARRAIDRPALVLDAGWFAGVQVNSIVPQPKEQRSVDGRSVLTFDKVPAGGRQEYFIGLQIDPTTVGRQVQNVSLRDGERTLLTIRRTLTVLP